MQSRRINAQHPEFFAGFVGSRASMTPPSASGVFVEVQPLIARLLKPPEAAMIFLRTSSMHQAFLASTLNPRAAMHTTATAPQVTPNPSLKRSANGRPPGPVWRYAVPFRQPGPGVLPSSPA